MRGEFRRAGCAWACGRVADGEPKVCERTRVAGMRGGPCAKQSTGANLPASLNERGNARGGCCVAWGRRVASARCADPSEPGLDDDFADGRLARADADAYVCVCATRVVGAGRRGRGAHVETRPRGMARWRGRVRAARPDVVGGKPTCASVWRGQVEPCAMNAMRGRNREPGAQRGRRGRGASAIRKVMQGALDGCG